MERPEDADAAVVSLSAPYGPRAPGPGPTYMLEASFHAGRLEFDGETVERVRKLAGAAPVVVIPHLDRSAVLIPPEPHCAAIAAVYGASDAAAFDALTGTVSPEGRLPFELPLPSRRRGLASR